MYGCSLANLRFLLDQNRPKWGWSAGAQNISFSKEIGKQTTCVSFPFDFFDFGLGWPLVAGLAGLAGSAGLAGLAGLTIYKTHMCIMGAICIRAVVRSMYNKTLTTHYRNL